MAAILDEVATDGAHDVLPEAAALGFRVEEEIEPRMAELGVVFLIGLDEADELAVELHDPAREVGARELGPDVVGLARRPPTRDLRNRVHLGDAAERGLR